MTFNDIFKSSFLENVTSVSIPDIILTLVTALCLGLFIYLIYKKTCRSIMYSESFGATLVALTMISALVILAITSNVVLSLGMVGALSIVRFRSAIKDPMDIAFLFWAIANGIVTAAGMIPLAVVGSVIIGITMLLFVNKKPGRSPYILIFQASSPESEKEALGFLNRFCERVIIKSKSIRPGEIEFSCDIRLKGDDTAFLNEFAYLPGVSGTTLLSYNGDYMA